MLIIQLKSAPKIAVSRLDDVHCVLSSHSIIQRLRNKPKIDRIDKETKKDRISNSTRHLTSSGNQHIHYRPIIICLQHNSRSGCQLTYKNFDSMSRTLNEPTVLSIKNSQQTSQNRHVILYLSFFHISNINIELVLLYLYVLYKTEIDCPYKNYIDIINVIIKYCIMICC